jgi:hypothetical protein
MKLSWKKRPIMLTFCLRLSSNKKPPVWLGTREDYILRVAQ